ncbi:hypothetical protein ACXEO8_06005 [Cytobacillus firmus]|uniref:hypothetical protein n=1 Tax=Bacillus sp. 22-7 TaxID=2709707 RepID=UPI0013D3D755|nr:hypothetical protein [Bacillus sp. 22-7]
MKEKLHHLQHLKDSMDKDLFKLAAASVLVKYFLEEMNNQGKNIERTKMLDRVNLSLRSIGCSEVSYGFMRGWL